MAGFRQLVADLGNVSASLQQVKQDAEQATKSVSTATQKLSSSLVEASASVSAMRQTVEQEVETAVGEMDRLTARASRLHPDLEEFLATLSGSGRPEDQSLLGTVRAYLEGIGDMSTLTRDWIGLSTSFKGELHSVNGLLADLLPSTGQIQQGFRTFLDQIRGQKDEAKLILEELRNSFNNISQGMANLADTILAGEKSVDALIEQLYQLRRAGFGGSEADILGTRLAELLDELDDSHRRGEI